MRILISGGCGFVGSNVAHKLSKDHQVIVMDNLSRPGSEKNMFWLVVNDNVKIFQWDVRSANKVFQLVSQVDAVVHLAGQVGVTQSIKKPREDFDINVQGTLNVLEAARAGKRPHVIFASTNKVYGKVGDKPVSEKQPLDFRTPYGCSKGAADQYLLDYDRIYGVPTTVLRMSCIYGDRQFGTEEQGWLAHFMFAHHNKQPITIYGDGTQVRDALYIDDYTELIKTLLEEKITGVYNIGGGPENTVSVNEAISKMAKALGDVPLSFADWRPDDQHTYISDITKISKHWKPQISVNEGLERLLTWVENPR